MVKKLLSIVLTLFMLFGMFSFNVSAAYKVGDPLGDVLYSDIVAYINGYAIPTSIKNGMTMVVVEDLLNYGFDVVWNGTAKTLSVTSNPLKKITPLPVEKNTKPVGTFKCKYVYTDIKTYLSGVLIESFAINGVTLIDFELLAKYGKLTWDGKARTISLAKSDNGPIPFLPPPSAENAENSLIGVWEGTQEGVQVRYEFKTDGNLIMTSISNGNTGSTEFPYIIISEGKLNTPFGDIIYTINGNTLNLIYVYNGMSVKLTKSDKSGTGAASAGAATSAGKEPASDLTLAMIAKAAKDLGYETREIDYFSPFSFEKETTPVAGIYVDYYKDYSSGRTAGGTSGDVGIYEFKDKAAADAYVKSQKNNKYEIPLQNGRFVAMLYTSDMFPTHNADIKAVFEKIIQIKAK